MRTFLCLLFILVAFWATAQQHPTPIYVSEDAPEWMHKLVSPNPNVWEIQKSYETYHKDIPFEKNVYTQYYKRWMHWARPYTQGDGTVVLPTAEEQLATENALKTERAQVQERGGNAGNWSFVGPKQTYHTNGSEVVTWQTNIYSVDIAPSDANILYAGGESGGLWRTTDKGLNWTLTTKNVLHGPFGAVKIHPTDPNTVFASTVGKIIKTTDGGATWTTAYSENNLWVNELYVQVNGTNVVILGASDRGLLRSTDNGATWTKVFTQETWTVKAKPGSPATVWAIRNTNGAGEYMSSSDWGANFAVGGTIWTPGSGLSVTGAIIAPCPSSPSKVYAYLCGQGGTLNGYVGVFVSNDEGANWSNTNPSNAIGGTYTIPTHTDLMAHDGTTGFDQGFYDMAIVVNPSNANQLIAGGTSWFKSTDGGATWSGLGGYVGSLGWSHPDIQWLAASGNDLWIASDGGLNYSTDFGASHEARMNGISGADMWGFDSGWNEDVLVGGRYHNGNMAWHESFPAGKFYRMGGAEAPTGYVNPGDARKVYHSDIGGDRLEGGFGGGTSSFAVARFPNESYAYYANSEMVWDPRCWNTIYLGSENTLWKSLDGGTSFEALYTFPGTAENAVYDIEIARTNPAVMYCSQWEGPDDKMWKSTNSGVSWTALTPLPLPNNNDRVKMAVSAEDANTLWVAVTYGSNGKKIYKSTNGGTSWTNLTTAALDGITIQNIMAQYGTDGGIYLGTNRGVYYRNNSHSDWQAFSNELPLSVETNRLKPFYKTGKIRNGCWGFGVWEADLFEPSAVVAQAMTSNLSPECARDTVYFDDYSVVNHAGAAWSWSFSPTPLTVIGANQRNPKVVFGTPGTYTATMTLNGSFQSTLTIEVANNCTVDTIPGGAVRLGNSSGEEGFLTIPALQISTNSITFSAWIKPHGIQNGYSSVFMHDGESAGLHFQPDNNHLGYHWPDGAWWWDSGLEVVQEQWNHVAMVVTATNITIYLNGVGATHNFTAEVVDFNSILRVGNYQGWSDRNCFLDVDEVCIFNQSLTQSQIRELMHLTKDPAIQSNLLVYYQCNEASGSAILDKVGTRHSAMVNKATRMVSTAPVGKGTSQRLAVSAAGSYNFNNAYLTLDFPAAGTYPNGELCVTHIRQHPDQLPSALGASQGYWVVNNYGTNSTFNALAALKFNNYGNIPTGAAPTSFALHKRSSVADGNTWGSSLGTASAVASTNNGQVDFTNNVNVTSFSQFIITNTVALPVEWLDFTASATKNQEIQLNWNVFQTADTKQFEVERSLDGQRFESLGTVPATNHAGNQAYTFLDRTPHNSTNYYRLKQWDKDGTYSYSVIRTVTVQRLPTKWVIYPNPVAVGGMVRLETYSQVPYRLNIYNQEGKQVYAQEAEGNISFPAKFPKGVYNCIVRDDKTMLGLRILIDN